MARAVREGGKRASFRWKNASIRWKIFLFMIAFCLVMLLILWLFQTVFLDRFYTAIKMADIEDEAALLAHQLEKGDLEGFEQRIAERGDLVAILAETDGSSEIIYGYFNEGVPIPPMGSQLLQALYQRTKEQGGTLSARFSAEEQSDTGGQLWHELQPEAQAPARDAGDKPGGGQFYRKDSLLHAAIVPLPGGGEVMMVLSAGILPVNATVQTLRVQLSYISVIMLVLGLGLALLIANLVAKPIERLMAPARELKSGNSEVHFEPGGYREITELADTLNQTAQELAKTEKLRQELIANVSHDLRTPLTLIIGYVEMMRDLPGENNPENMQVVIDEAKRLSTLVTDLLDLSRLQAGTEEIRLERLDISCEVEQIILRFSKFAGPEGYTVDFETPGPVFVMGDETRLGQVIYNFLINGMNHGGEGKKLLVRLTRGAGRVKVEVVDDGPGISPEEMPYIWDRYYKVDRDHKRAATGTGLGLSIVKSILQQHPDMEYGVESQPGRGSAFWFSLPEVAPAPQ